MVEVESATLQTHVDRYNFASTEKQRRVLVTISLTDGRRLAVSECFPLDNEEVVDLKPWDIEKGLSLIETRAEGYWINTGREKTLAAVEEMRPWAIEASCRVLQQDINRLDRELQLYKNRWSHAGNTDGDEL